MLRRPVEITNAKETLRKNFPQQNFDSRLVRMKQSLKRLEKRCRDGRESAMSRHSSDKENPAQTGVIDESNDAHGGAAVGL